MVKQTILVNLDRCVGCWSCAMACKINNDLPEDTWFATVRTLGNGDGIDRPSGVWPNLRMSWMPVYSKSCTLCAARIADGELPHCVNSCPTLALTFGDLDDPDSDVATKLNALTCKGYKNWRLPAWENSKANVVYTSRR